MNNHSCEIRQVQWSNEHQSLLAIRTTVFVDEQNVPIDLEIDGLDPGCIHVLAIDSTGRPAGTARMQKNGHIGRMAVLKSARNKGIGRDMMLALIEIARQQNMHRVFLHAQIIACKFYEKQGFKKYGQIFMDAGIAHIAMELVLS